jgi:uncharacterized membrane protein YcjF (UPF0283 family)
MSEPTRIPGRIDEEASAVGVSIIQPGNGVPGATDGKGSATNRPLENREPGLVEEPSEPMPDDQISARTLEIIGSGPTERGPWGLVFWVFSINVFLWLCYEVSTAIFATWQQHSWLGLLLSVTACAFLVVLGWAGRREYVAIKAIDTLAERCARMRESLASNNLTELRDTLEPTLRNLRQRDAGRIAEFEAAANSRETAAEYLQQFDNLVLIHLDEEANAVIRRSFLGTAAAVAIVPHPTLDAVIVLWRATVLIRRIGEIYGLAPTGLSSLRLLKHSIASAIIAAGADVAAGLVVEQLGADLARQVLSGLAEGAVTARRLYRLGIYAQKLCRPITE